MEFPLPVRKAPSRRPDESEKGASNYGSGIKRDRHDSHKTTFRYLRVATELSPVVLRCNVQDDAAFRTSLIRFASFLALGDGYQIGLTAKHRLQAPGDFHMLNCGISGVH